MAVLRASRAHVFRFGRTPVASSARHLKMATLAGRAVAGHRAYFNSLFLGSHTGRHGDPAGDVHREVSAIDGHPLVASCLFLCLCSTYDWDNQPFLIA